MKLNPSEDFERSATQEVRNILWNPKVRYRVRKSTPLVPTHSTPAYFINIYI
jgi:hypothetical protein